MFWMLVSPAIEGFFAALSKRRLNWREPKWTATLGVSPLTARNCISSKAFTKGLHVQYVIFVLQKLWNFRLIKTDLFNVYQTSYIKRHPLCSYPHIDKHTAFVEGQTTTCLAFRWPKTQHTCLPPLRLCISPNFVRCCRLLRGQSFALLFTLTICQIQV
jgi:hypothetical protein